MSSKVAAKPFRGATAYYGEKTGFLPVAKSLARRLDEQLEQRSDAAIPWPLLDLPRWALAPVVLIGGVVEVAPWAAAWLDAPDVPESAREQVRQRRRSDWNEALEAIAATLPRTRGERWHSRVQRLCHGAGMGLFPVRSGGITGLARQRGIALDTRVDHVRAEAERQLIARADVPLPPIKPVRTGTRGADGDLHASMELTPARLRRRLEQATQAAIYEAHRRDSTMRYALPHVVDLAAYKRWSTWRLLQNRELVVSGVSARGPWVIETNLAEVKRFSDALRQDYDAARQAHIGARIGASSHGPAMLTVTLPPAFHARGKQGGRTVQEGVDVLQDLHRSAYKHAHRALGEAPACIRVIEPHRDGTPHLHLVGDAQALQLYAEHIARKVAAHDARMTQRHVLQLESARHGLLKIVDHDAHGEAAKRARIFRRPDDVDAGRSIAGGHSYPCLLRLDRFPAGTHAGRLVQYLVRYVTADRDQHAGQDSWLAAQLGDSRGKAKTAAAMAWRAAAGITARTVAYLGVDVGRTIWLGVHRAAESRHTPAPARALLHDVLRRFAAGEAWEPLACEAGVHVDKDAGRVETSQGNGYSRSPDASWDWVSSQPQAPAHLLAAEAAAVPTSAAAWDEGEDLGFKNNCSDSQGFSGTDATVGVIKDIHACDGSSPALGGAGDGSADASDGLPVNRQVLTPGMLWDALSRACYGDWGPWDRPISCLAAPGAGKTQTIVDALYILETMRQLLPEHEPAFKPLVIAYRTRKAARDTSERLAAAGVRVQCVLGGQRARPDPAKTVITTTSAMWLSDSPRTPAAVAGCLLVDEAQDIPQEPAVLEVLAGGGGRAMRSDRRAAPLVGWIGDARQTLMPDCDPTAQAARFDMLGDGVAVQARLATSRRCPTVIAAAASSAAPEYPAIESEREGGLFRIAHLPDADQRQACEEAVVEAIERLECDVTGTVVIQADTWSSAALCRVLARRRLGVAKLPQRLSISTVPQIKGSTHTHAIYIHDTLPGGKPGTERPGEYAATAISRATQTAVVFSYGRAA